MALTQIKSGAIADDAIDSSTFADESIDNAHLADDAVDSDELAAGSVDIAHLAAGTDGKIITWDANGAAAVVGPGTDGQVLTSTGAGSPPAFEDAAGGGATLSGSTNNTVVTVTGSNAMQGEANLTFDGSTLDVTGAATFTTSVQIGGVPDSGSYDAGFKAYSGGEINVTASSGASNLWKGRTAATATPTSTITAAGAATFAGSVKIGGTADANEIDEYEEGTWTPVLKFGGGNTGLTVSYYTGNYTKIGNTVHYYFRVNLTDKGSSTGAATIEGLPFPCGAYICSTIGRIYSANSLSGPVIPQTVYNGSGIDLKEQDASGDSNLTDTHFNDTSQLMFLGTYFI